jgi:NADP-dependent 3-hydroxy acid dehydrogenase YdfG
MAMANRVVVITGASSGIGAALAQLLGAGGDSLILVARRQQRLQDIARRSGDARAIVADVTRRQEVQTVVRDALRHFHHVDVWINNAGRGISRPPSELTDEDIDEMMRINVKSVLYGMQEILPYFKERGTGHIINISSMLGRVPFVVIRSAYSASKHFMNALTAMFRQDVQQTHPGIQISLVSPGVVQTEFGLSALHGGPDSRSMPNSQTAEEVARVVARVIDSRATDVYTFPNAGEVVLRYYARLGGGA